MHVHPVGSSQELRVTKHVTTQKHSVEITSEEKASTAPTSLKCVHAPTVTAEAATNPALQNVENVQDDFNSDILSK